MGARLPTTCRRLIHCSPRRMTSSFRPTSRTQISCIWLKSLPMRPTWPLDGGESLTSPSRLLNRLRCELVEGQQAKEHQQGLAIIVAAHVHLQVKRWSGDCRAAALCARLEAFCARLEARLAVAMIGHLCSVLGPFGIGWVKPLKLYSVEEAILR